MKKMILGALLMAAGAAQAQAPAMAGMDHGASMKGMAMSAGADMPAPPGISVQACWIRLLPASVPSAGYFTVRNAGARPATLVGIRSEAFGMAMLHQTRQDAQGMSRMVAVQSVPVPARGELSFAPGGYHAMLEKPARPLHAGEMVPMTLIFGGKQALTTQCEARAPGSGQ